MTSFWIAVVVSILSATFFIWSSVAAQLQNTSIKTEQTKPIMLIPVLILVLIPVAYYSLGNIDKHKSWLRTSIEMDNISSGNAPISKNMGIQSMILGLRTVIDQDQKNAQLWFMLAEAYFQLRMIDLSDLAIQRAIRIDAKPDWYVANAQILSARSNSTDISKSVNLLQNALSIEPEHQAALLTLGFIYLRQQQYEFAIETWQRLSSLLERGGNDTSTIQKQIEFAKQQLSERRKSG